MSLRKFLNVVLNEKIVKKMKHDLKRGARIEIFHVMFYLKERYRNVIDENNTMFEKEIKITELEKKFRRNIIEFIKKNHNFQKNIILNSRYSTSMTNLSSVADKCFVKISNSSLFSNEKNMSVFQ